MARVEIVTYDKQWPSDFRDIAASLQALLGPEVIAIDHIGSTAVPGLSAKPLVDIDVTLPSREHVFAAITTIERAGYENRGNRFHDEIDESPAPGLFTAAGKRNTSETPAIPRLPDWAFPSCGRIFSA